MTITINTDASFHPTHKVGAFAFWIVCEQGRIIHSGPLKKVINAQDAELQSIANALYVIYKSTWSGIKHIYINTDCKWGIEAVTKGKRMNGCLNTVKQIQTIINRLVQKYEYRRKKNKFKSFISWRYVVAHSEGEDKRRWVNNRMDSMAKEAMWKLVNELQNNNDKS